MSDYSDKIKERKRLQTDSIISVVNKVTPPVVFRYALKQPSFFDYYEGEAPLKWQDIIAAEPLRVIFQITVGRHGRHWNDEMDYQVANFVSQASSWGQRYGLYHLLVPNSITEQIDFYCRSVDTVGGWGYLSPILDIEYEPPTGRDTFRGTAWAEQIHYALTLLESRSGAKPMIYWSRKFAGYTADRYGNLPLWMNEYWHWMAGYPWVPFVDANVTIPQTYLAQGVTVANWAAWQYAEDGRYRGYPANDLSLVNPSYVDYLLSMYGG